ncbi:hypothetical protein D3C76_1688890 [compost metagenome]|uniref:Uncharacterized protein n=1 Tax=Pseudomonas fluorescens TaxID=294 RepID=A0A5E7S9D7_PSEFL|nr:hypothetical protein PS938_00819 [Pseudomonas fluorescens]
MPTGATQRCVYDMTVNGMPDTTVDPAQILCRSEPARDSGGSATIITECGAAIASRLTPTGSGDDLSHCEQ